MRIIVIAVLIVIIAIIQPVYAEDCQQVKDHRFCLVSLQRSAKRYWEYWAMVSVDAQRPVKVMFNCRDRIQIQADGTSSNVLPESLGDRVCRLYRP